MEHIRSNINYTATSDKSILNKEISIGLISFILIIIFFQVSMAQPLKPTFSQQKILSVPCLGTVKYHKNGKIKSCYLAQNYEVEGNLLPAGSKLFFWDNGNPSECWISKEANFYGQLLPAKTSVFFNRWGHKFCFWLPKEMRIQGHLIASTNDGIGNSLHLNGKLKAIWLAGDEDINGIPCSSSENIFKYGFHVMSLGTKRMVWFYDTGQLQQAMISHEITIQGYQFKKGDIIYFDKNGKIDLNSKKNE
jgi:hypothetical protein